MLEIYTLYTYCSPVYLFTVPDKTVLNHRTECTVQYETAQYSTCTQELVHTVCTVLYPVTENFIGN